MSGNITFCSRFGCCARCRVAAAAKPRDISRALRMASGVCEGGEKKTIIGRKVRHPLFLCSFPAAGRNSSRLFPISRFKASFNETHSTVKKEGPFWQALFHCCWLEVTEPSATNLACVARLNLWGVEWRGDLVDLASKSHRVIRVVTERNARLRACCCGRHPRDRGLVGTSEETKPGRQNAVNLQNDDDGIVRLDADERHDMLTCVRTVRCRFSGGSHPEPRSVCAVMCMCRRRGAQSRSAHASPMHGASSEGSARGHRSVSLPRR